MKRAALLVGALGVLLSSNAGADEPVPDRDPTRLRLGFGVEGGVSAGDSNQLLATFAPRVGVQWNTAWATYLQVRPYFGGTLRGSGSWLGGVHITPLVEASLAQHVLLGVGPSLDLQGVNDCASCAAPMTGVGGEARLAVRIFGPDQGHLDGGRGPRSGILLHLSGHPTWFSSDVFSMFTFFGASFEFY